VDSIFILAPLSRSILKVTVIVALVSILACGNCRMDMDGMEQFVGNLFRVFVCLLGILDFCKVSVLFCFLGWQSEVFLIVVHTGVG